MEGQAFLTALCPVPCPSAGQMRVPAPTVSVADLAAPRTPTEWHAHSLIPLSLQPPSPLLTATSPSQWKKHWFVLTDSSLKYYRDSTAEEVRRGGRAPSPFRCWGPLEGPWGGLGEAPGVHGPSWPSCCRQMSWMARLTCAAARMSPSMQCSATMASRSM